MAAVGVVVVVAARSGGGPSRDSPPVRHWPLEGSIGEGPLFFWGGKGGIQAQADLWFPWVLVGRVTKSWPVVALVWRL